jgi:D-aminopeptidase
VSDELGAALEIEARGGGITARFDGMLGRGRPERVAPAGRDVWLVATRRSMDAPAPGDWTLTVGRDASGNVAGLTLGSWLARGIGYRRQA